MPQDGPLNYVERENVDNVLRNNKKHRTNIRFCSVLFLR